MGKTISEKIFDAHHVDSLPGNIRVIGLDAVFCHEITTPIAIDDLIRRGKDRVFDPDRIKAVRPKALKKLKAKRATTS